MSDTIRADLRWLDLDRSDANDRVRWKNPPPDQDMSAKSEQGEHSFILQCRVRTLWTSRSYNLIILAAGTVYSNTHFPRVKVRSSTPPVC